MRNSRTQAGSAIIRIIYCMMILSLPIISQQLNAQSRVSFRFGISLWYSEADSLRGSVKSLNTKSYVITQEKQQNGCVRVEKEFYNTSGNITELTRFPCNGTPTQSTYQYNGAHRLTRITTTGENGDTIAFKCFDYDTTGHLIKERSIFNGKKLTYELLEVYSYNGNETTHRQYRNDTLTSTSIFKYDEHKNITEYWRRDADGGESRTKHTYKYDRRYNIVRETEIDSELKNHAHRDTSNVSSHIQDAKKTTREYKKGLLTRVIVFYTENGLPTKDIVTYKYDKFGGVVQEDELRSGKFRSRVQVAYERDKKGNWTKQTRKETDDYIDVEERVIEYY